MRFLAGDELGNIKSLRYSPVETNGKKTETKSIHQGNVDGKNNAIQALAVATTNGVTLLAAGYADGSAAAYSLNDDTLEVIHEWKESRLKSEQTYVGLCITERDIYSCTSNGALRLTTIEKDDEPAPQSQLTSLPTRLYDWRLSPGAATFAYGGEEVDLSVWNTERAFRGDAASTAVKKRKRGDCLFPGEVWRAKNLPNDFLGLRQPIRLTSLTYISSPSGSQHHLLAGTQFGDLRRYDTRAARRPVANWNAVGKIGGIRVVEKGLAEHETFVGDYGGNLFSLDLRTGGVVYGYKGLAGAVTSIAPSPSLLASTALDRFFRIHSTFAPPPEARQQQERKGEVLDKIFMKSTPTVVIWDQEITQVSNVSNITDEDDVWNNMTSVDDDSDEELGGRKKRKDPQDSSTGA